MCEPACIHMPQPYTCTHKNKSNRRPSLEPKYCLKYISLVLITAVKVLSAIPWWWEFNPWAPLDGRKEPVPQSCPLTLTGAPYHVPRTLLDPCVNKCNNKVQLLPILLLGWQNPLHCLAFAPWHPVSLQKLTAGRSFWICSCWSFSQLLALESLMFPRVTVVAATAVLIFTLVHVFTTPSPSFELSLDVREDSHV